MYPEKNLVQDLFKRPLSVINVGIEKLVEHLPSYGVEVTQVDWKPPVVTNVELLRKLRSLAK